MLAVDSNYPNLALMKVSAWHKSQGDTVEWYNPFDTYDRLYMAKVFSFTPDYGFVIANVRGEVVRGGTGYDIRSSLPGDMDRLQPDYSLYPAVDSRTSYGFLTRGCPNRCRWCVVPQKEGGIRPYMDVDDITLHGERPYAVLMDNNVLACDYGLSQLEKIAERGYHVDFNQGLDARLVTPDVARLLARVKWIKRIRFGCDTPAQIVATGGSTSTCCPMRSRIVTSTILTSGYRNGKRTWPIGLTAKSCTARAISRTLARAKASFAANTLHKNNL